MSSRVYALQAVLVSGLLAAAASADIRVLCVPSDSDPLGFRAALAAELGGATVDYFDPRPTTPSTDLLLTYDCVITWCDWDYHNPTLFGDRLADYVDAGGSVVLGQWCFGFDAVNHLGGRIMEPEYCPVTDESTGWGSGEYAGDGSDAVHAGVDAYDAPYLNVITELAPGARSDGTFTPYASPAVIWRPDRRVYYSPGNVGATYWGEWARLSANMVLCTGWQHGDLNCDGAINAFDIDPFVLALTSPEYSYAPQFPHCDYMLADCNGDGVVNAFDIDPFVALLVRAR